MRLMLLLLTVRGLALEKTQLPPSEEATVTVNPFSKVIGGSANQNSAALSAVAPGLTGGLHSSLTDLDPPDRICTEGTPSAQRIWASPASSSPPLPSRVTELTAPADP